jgi:plasmid replication initiation protein
MKQNLEAIHSNIIVQSSFALSANKQKLLLLAAARVNDAQKRIDGKLKNFEIEIHSSDFGSSFGIPVKAKRVFASACKGLFDEEIKYKNENNDTVHLRWINKLTIMPNSESVKIRFNEEVFEKMANLQNQFTIVKIESVVKMQSGYAIRLYQILSQWRSTLKYTVTLEALRWQLCVENKYPKFKDFNKMLLKPVIKEVNEHSKDLHILDVKTEKRGRFVHSLTFLLENKRKRVVHPDYQSDVMAKTLKNIESNKKKKKINNLPVIDITPKPENLELGL